MSHDEYEGGTVVTEKDEVCFGCGLPPVVQVNERKLCGNCFLVGISVSLQAAGQETSDGRFADASRGAHLQELRSTLQTAIEEIQRLRQRLDDLMRENAKLKDNS